MPEAAEKAKAQTAMKLAIELRYCEYGKRVAESEYPPPQIKKRF